MKRTVAALSIVAVACAPAADSKPQAIPAQPPQPRATASASLEPAPTANVVLERIIRGGEVVALLASSCETLVVAAGRTPEQRVLEIDTSESIGCSAKRKTGLLLDMTDPQHIKFTGARQSTGRTSVVIGCPIEEPRATATPRSNEAFIDGVRLFSDRPACEAMIARETLSHAPACFETELARALEQRNDQAPTGDFVTRFEKFIDDPSSTAWQRSEERGGICEPWHVKRTDTGFAFFRDRTEKKITTVHSEATFSYDPRCKRVTAGAQSTTWTTPGHGGRGTSHRGSWSASVGPSTLEDELPLTGEWFYTRRGCERSPRN